MMSRSRATLMAVLGLFLTVGSTAHAVERPPANVPPSLEIEVLDPGVDPEGNPAVVLKEGHDGQMIVDIPPVVLVHRYYYSGDRSFQGPMLPGGPSILVVNHPKTGERCYIDAQMMPGAPQVTYTKHGIEYNYGEQAVTLHFGITGKPSIKYRSGLPINKRVSNFVHAEHWQTQAKKAAQSTKNFASGTKLTIQELYVDTANTVEQLSMPVKAVGRLIPFGVATFDSDRHRTQLEKIAAYKRKKEQLRQRKQNLADQATLPSARR